MAVRLSGFPRLRRHLLGIHQAIAAHPDPVAGFWQVGDDVAAPLVGDDDLGEAGAEITGLGDDPDPGLRAKPAGDGPADRLVVNRDRRWVACFRLSRLLSARHTGGDEKCGDGNNRQRNLAADHVPSPASHSPDCYPKAYPRNQAAETAAGSGRKRNGCCQLQCRQPDIRLWRLPTTGSDPCGHSAVIRQAPGFRR